MVYQTHTLSNGIRLLHVPDASPITYCGFAVNAGTRDELDDEQGMAHFVEHMLFKGTSHRKSWHIINWLESVGGQVDYQRRDVCVRHRAVGLHATRYGIVVRYYVSFPVSSARTGA